MTTDELIQELLPFVKEDSRTEFSEAVEKALAPKRRSITLNEALNIVCEKTKCDKDAVMSKSRKGLYPFSRQLVMFIMKGCNKNMGLCEIGKMLGKDHATVLHSVRAVRQDYVGCKPRKVIIDEVLLEVNSIDLYRFI